MTQSSKDQHLEFLRNRLKEVESRIIKTPDWQEAKSLKVLIARLEAEVTDSEQKQRELEAVNNPQPLPSGLNLIPAAPFKRDCTKGHTKDLNNTLLPDARHGEKISGIYDMVEQLAIDNGGTIDIAVAAEWLREVQGITLKNPKDKIEYRIASYLTVYNKNHEDDVRLKLWPEKQPHQQRMGKYQKILYVGKQRMAV